MILFTAGIGLFTTCLTVGGAIWLNTGYFSEELSRRVRVASDLVHLDISGRIENMETGIRMVNADRETLREVLVGLSAKRPRRKNFFNYFFSLADMAEQFDIHQYSVHFVSAGNPEPQVYTVYEQGKVYSFSTKKGKNGKGLLKLEKDEFGFAGPKKDQPEQKRFVLPIGIDTKTKDLRFVLKQNRLYMDATYPLINENMGKKDSEGFIQPGLTYGMIRMFIEIPGNWNTMLEKRTGVKIDIYLKNGKHALGDLKKAETAGHLSETGFFDQTVMNAPYISRSFPIQMGQKTIGHMTASVPRSVLSKQKLNTAYTLMAIGLFAVVISVIVASLLIFLIVRPIMALEKSAGQIARGRLSYPIETGRRDEIGRLASSFAHMRNSIRKQIHGIGKNSKTLTASADEISASLENISGLLGEMSIVARRNSENADHTDGFMARTVDVIGKSGEFLTMLGTSMERISSASREISEIAGIIDGIAFQTKLLALNASVEAARAGDAGSGFAVVANEVQNLAARSAEAAQNTERLIANTEQIVRNASEIVDRTNDGFQEVTENAAGIARLLGEISTASAEQCGKIDQITESLNEMNTITRRNAEAAEALSSSVNIFKVEDNSLMPVHSRSHERR